jgi:hypothetical protein
LITAARPTVEALLRAAPAGVLADALAHRPDVTVPAPASIAELADRVVRPRSVHAALDGVDRWAWQVAEAATVRGGPTTAEAIASLLRAADGSMPSIADVDRALDRLGARLVVFRDGDGVWLNPGLLGVLATPAGLGPPVRLLLEPMTADELRGMASRLVPGTKVRRKAELLELLLGRFADLSFVAGLVDRAPQAAVGVLRAARSDTVDLPFGTHYWRAAARPVRLDDPHQWLLAHGLLVGSGWGGQAVVPREVGLALRGGVIRSDAEPVAPRPRLVEADQPAVDRAGASRSAVLVRLVGRLLEELAARPAEPLKSGGLGAREIKRLARACDVDPTELRLALELCRVAGLLPAAWQAVAPTSTAEAWMHDEPAQQWLSLAAAWLDDSGAPLSVNGTKDPMGDALPSGVPVNGLPARPVRDALLGTLGELEPGRAAAEGIHHAVAWRSAAYLDRLPSELAERAVDWIVEEASVLGLVAAGALTSVGRALWDGDPAAAAAAVSELSQPAPATVIVQADHSIIVDAGAPPKLLAELRALADVESTGAALVLRLTPASVRRALDSGRSGDELLRLLTEHAPEGVPQPIVYLIHDTARRWGRVRTGTATCYVRSDDASLLAEAAVNRKLAKLGLRVIAPTVAVSDAPHDIVLAALREAGFLPAPEGADGAVLVTPPVRHQSPVTTSPRPMAAAGVMTAEQRRDLVATLLAAPDAPARRPSTAGRAGASGRRQRPDLAMPELFDRLTELEGLDLDDADDLDEIDHELVELMATAEADGAPVELVRLDAGTLSSITGRVLVFDPVDLVAIVAQEPGDVEVVIDMNDVVAFRPLGLNDGR